MQKLKEPLLNKKLKAACCMHAVAFLTMELKLSYQVFARSYRNSGSIKEKVDSMKLVLNINSNQEHHQLFHIHLWNVRIHLKLLLLLQFASVWLVFLEWTAAAKDYNF